MLSGCIGRANNLKKHPRCERIVLQRPGFDWGVEACTRLCAPCRCTVYNTLSKHLFKSNSITVYNTIHCLYCIIPCHTMLVYYGVVHHDMEHHPSVMHHALVLCTPAACRDGVVLQPHPSPRTIFWCTEQYSGFICTRVTQSSKTAPVWDPSYQWNMDVLI